MYWGLYIAIPVIFILCGVILLVRGKVMVSQILFNLLNFVCSTLFFLYLQNRIGLLLIIILNFAFILLFSLVYKGKYIIFGVNSNRILPILKDVLNKEKVSHEEKDYFLQLTDYNKCIFYNQSFDSVSIDLNEIRNLPLYETIKDELKNRIPEIDLRLYPTMATIYIVGGVSIILILGIILKM